MRVYVDDGSPVPDGVRVFEDRFGPVMELLARIDGKLDELLKR